MLRELKGWDRDRTDMDNAIALLAFGKILKAEYEANQLDPPEWLLDTTRAIKREIEERRRDYKVRELKTLRAKFDAIQNKDLTAADIKKKIDALANELG